MSMGLMFGGDIRYSPEYFQVYRSTNQAITVLTKVDFDTADYNINTIFNLTTDRATPTQPGLWLFGFNLSGSVAIVQIALSFNGATFIAQTASAVNSTICVARYMNGTTDYVEAYANFNGNILGNANRPTCFWGYKV